METVYVGLGGNIGDAVDYLNLALKEISAISHLTALQSSNFYSTTPVGFQDQNTFVNAVCSFKTSLSLKELHKELQRIEIKLGKRPKVKFAPRKIDLDILFFGEQTYCDGDLCIPHPSWNDRLFVLIPLSELISEITIKRNSEEQINQYNIYKLLKTFPNKHQETVTFLTKPRCLGSVDE